MKKKAFLSTFLVALVSISCFLFRPRVLPYPLGVSFPVEESSRIDYDGEIAGRFRKSGAYLCFSTQKGLVYCVESTSQKQLWDFNARAPILFEPYLTEEGIFFFDSGGSLYCLDRNGGLVWEKKVGEKVTAAVSGSEGRLYYGTEDGEFFALDLSSGDELWRYQAAGPIRARAVFYGSSVIFGCDDGKLYFLSTNGSPLGSVELGGKIRVAPLVDGDRLYAGSEMHVIHCLDATRRKSKWKVKTGSFLLNTPVADDSRLFFLCSDNVLYCLDKKGGDILWWRAVRARCLSSPEVSGDRVVVSALPSLVFGFDARTGKEAGEYDAGKPLRGNPLWLDPFLLLNSYDSQSGAGSLIFLKKVVRVTLEASKSPPQKISEEVVFTASATGFFEPRFEFYVNDGREERVVQPLSEKNTWTWFLDREGTYTVGVRVADQREKALAEVAFEVTKDQEEREYSNTD